MTDVPQGFKFYRDSLRTFDNPSYFFIFQSLRVKVLEHGASSSEHTFKVRDIAALDSAA